MNTFISNENTNNNINSQKIESATNFLNILQNSINSLQSNITTNTDILNNLNNEIINNSNTTGIIGEINLIDNIATNFGAEGVTSNNYGFTTGTVTLYEGKTYTLTVCGSSSQEAIDNGQHLLIDMYNEAWTEIASLNFNEITPTVKQVNITVPKTETYMIDSYSFPYKADSKNVTIYWYNVREGEVGTAWVPSLYDLQNILDDKKEQ